MGKALHRGKGEDFIYNTKNGRLFGEAVFPGAMNVAVCPVAALSAVGLESQQVVCGRRLAVKEARGGVHLEEGRYWPWLLHIFFAGSPSPHGGYMIITEKPARASEQRAWAGF